MTLNDMVINSKLFPTIIKKIKIFYSVIVLTSGLFSIHEVFSQEPYDKNNYNVPVSFHHDFTRINLTREEFLIKYNKSNLQIDSTNLYIKRSTDSTYFAFDSLDRLHSYAEYDALGNLQYKTIIQYDLKGNIVKIITENGRLIHDTTAGSFFQNALSKKTDSVGNTLKERTSYFIYNYNEKKQLISEKQFNGYDVLQSGSYLEYNSAGELIKEIQVDYVTGISRDYYNK